MDMRKYAKGELYIQLLKLLGGSVIIYLLAEILKSINNLRCIT